MYTTAPPSLSTAPSSGMNTMPLYTTTMEMNPTKYPVGSSCICPPTSQEGEVTVAPGMTPSTLSTTVPEDSGGMFNATTTTIAVASTISGTAATAEMSSGIATGVTTIPPVEATEMAACSCPTNGKVVLEVNAGGGEVFGDSGLKSEVFDTSADDALNQYWMPMDSDIVNAADMDLALGGKGYFLRSHVSGKSFQYAVSLWDLRMEGFLKRCLNRTSADIFFLLCGPQLSPSLLDYCLYYCCSYLDSCPVRITR